MSVENQKRKSVKSNSRYVTIRFTHGEVEALNHAVGNCYGDGDWINYLKNGGGGDNVSKAIKDFKSGWNKLGGDA